MAENLPTTLCKYSSADTAKQILASQALRWSSPCLLGNPFELTHETELPFSREQLLQGALKATVSLIFAKDMPSGRAPLMSAVRRWREEERFHSPEEAEEQLESVVSQLVQQRDESLTEIINDWKAYTRRLRLCCMVAKPDNLAAWDAYGDNHRGVVLKFAADGSTTIDKAYKVKYVETHPSITTMKEQLGVMIASENYKAQAHFDEKFIQRAPAYNNQQEWRCFYEQNEEENPIAEDSKEWFIDRTFSNDDLNAVYFGIDTPHKDKVEIYQLVKQHFTSVKFFDHHMAAGKYEMVAVRITDKLA